MNWVYIVTLIVVHGVTDSKAWCPVGWLEYGSSCYFFATELETWITAEISCKAHNAMLAEVMNKGQLDFLAKTLNEKGMYGDRWIGGHRDEIHTHVWRWAWTDNVITNTLWQKGQPDNHSGRENCIELKESFDWKWNDKSCSHQQPFICEKIIPVTTTTTTTTTQQSTTSHVNIGKPAIPEFLG